MYGPTRLSFPRPLFYFSNLRRNTPYWAFRGGWAWVVHEIGFRSEFLTIAEGLFILGPLQLSQHPVRIFRRSFDIIPKVLVPGLRELLVKMPRQERFRLDAHDAMGSTDSYGNIPV